MGIINSEFYIKPGKCFLILLLLLLTGCVTFVASNSGASVAVVSAAETIDQTKTAADVISYGVTRKTLTDHTLDIVTGLDCNLVNLFNKSRKVCRERVPNLNTPEKN